MADELADFGRRVERVVESPAMRRVLNKAGMAGKKAAMDAAAADLGNDRAFSGFRRRAALSAGYDVQADAQVQINLRPAGLWRLAEAGRKGTKPIRPRRGRQAVLTPQGPRARSTSKPSKGLGTFGDAARDARREVPKAAARQFHDEVRKVVR